eukprot:scaffold138_cov145-Chaetoceros_neogracile.AAC.7
MGICCCTSWGWAGPPGAGQCRIACANVDDEVYAIQAGVQDAHLIYTMVILLTTILSKTCLVS